MMKNYVSKIQELEGHLLHLQNLHHSKHRITEWTDSDDDSLNVKNESCLNELPSHPGTKVLNLSGKIFSLVQMNEWLVPSLAHK